MQCLEHQFSAWLARQSKESRPASVPTEDEKLNHELVNFHQDKTNGYSNDRITKCINDNAKLGPSDLEKWARKCFEQQFQEWRVKQA